jgi:cytochrome oxidase assembly protein ShyY1
MTPSRLRDAARLAVTPRWLVALLVLLVLVAVAVLLGRWQWDRTQTILAAERAAAEQPIGVTEVFADAGVDVQDVPAEGIGRPVTATGAYDPAMQVSVSSRELDGRPGVWIVTGLRQDDGSIVAVLRGWLPDATDPGAAVPTTDVTVTGVLQPDESFYANADTPAGTVASIAHDRLGALWNADLLPGFVVLKSQDPLAPPAPLPVPQTVQTADVPFPLQNFFYAFQWWIFAAFGVVVYLRWLWTESAGVVSSVGRHEA